MRGVVPLIARLRAGLRAGAAVLAAHDQIRGVALAERLVAIQMIAIGGLVPDLIGVVVVLGIDRERSLAVLHQRTSDDQQRAGVDAAATGRIAPDVGAGNDAAVGVALD